MLHAAAKYYSSEQVLECCDVCIIFLAQGKGDCAVNSIGRNVFGQKIL